MDSNVHVLLSFGFIGLRLARTGITLKVCWGIDFKDLGFTDFGIGVSNGVEGLGIKDFKGIGDIDLKSIRLEFIGFVGVEIKVAGILELSIGLSFESIWDTFSVDAFIDVTGLTIFDADFIGLE